jgi:hypothetical protein
VRLVRGEHAVAGYAERRLRFTVGVHAHRHELEAIALPVVVDHLMLGDAVQPRPQVIPAESVQLGARQQQRLLSDVGRVRRVRHPPQYEFMDIGSRRFYTMQAHHPWTATWKQPSLTQVTDQCATADPRQLVENCGHFRH